MKKIRNYINQHTPILIALITLISLLIAPIIIKLIFNTDSGIEFLQIININNSNAWIGYYGSIIGGTITLIGVWWTIKDNEKQRMNNLAIYYKPIIKVSNPKAYKKTKLPPYRILNIFIDIENIGRGEALNLTFNKKSNKDSCKISNVNMYNDCNFIENIKFITNDFECLPAKNKKQLNIEIGFKNNFSELSFILDITFKNAFSNEIIHHMAKIIIKNNKIEENNPKDMYNIIIENYYK